MIQRKFYDFSVLISVYWKENFIYLRDALDSVLNQTLVPNEIVLVKDGPLSEELELVIAKYVCEYPEIFKIVTLVENKGLGNALAVGINSCTNELIARMDSDDICFHDRFEKQINHMLKNTEVSVLGTSVREFNVKTNDLDTYRRLPVEFNSIIKFAKFRNPLNHPSVIFKKTDVIAVNSYVDMPFFEDYFLWIRLIKKGYIIENLYEPLLHFRVGNDMIGRRHGHLYLKSELRFITAAKSLRFINLFQYIISILLKTPLRLIPKSFLLFIYRKFLR